MAAGIVLRDARVLVAGQWLPATVNLSTASALREYGPLRSLRYVGATNRTTLSRLAYDSIVGATLWSVDRLRFDRQMLARTRRVSLAAPRPLAAVALDRPEIVRRAPTPAGRPYGWRRRRKAGRWTT